MSIQHAVLLGFEPELGPQDEEEMLTQVRAWPEAIGGFEALRVGRAISTERTRGYHYLLFMERADDAALAEYQVHPVHQRFAAWVVDHGGTVLALDYHLDDATVVVPGPSAPGVTAPPPAPTELLYHHDAYLCEFDAVVVAVDGDRLALDRTAFYPTGGGQPHDVGAVGAAAITAVAKENNVVWHTVDGPPAAPGTPVHGAVDWTRRHALMRTHTALHILCGVIWHRWQKAVTGGSMEPLSARMDFEFDPLPQGFGATVEELVNAEIAASRPILVRFVPRDALREHDLIRTKSSLVPDSVPEVRVVDIVGLDTQADGGTHVHNTSEVGHVRVVKTESKGRQNKRIRIELTDA